MLYAFFDKAGEVIHIGFLHLRLGDIAAQHLAGNGVKQQARGGVGVVRIFFDQGARSQNGCFKHLFHRHAVVQITHGLGDDGFGMHISPQAFASSANTRAQLIHVQHFALSAVNDV